MELVSIERNKYLTVKLFPRDLKVIGEGVNRILHEASIHGIEDPTDKRVHDEATLISKFIEDYQAQITG